MKELKRTIYFISLPLSFIGFIFPIYASTVGASTMQIGYLFSIFSIIGIIMRPVVGNMIDKKGRKIGVILGTIFYMLANLFYILAKDYNYILIGRIIQSLGAAILWISVNTYISDISDKTNRAKNFGSLDVTMAKASWIGSIIGFTILFYGIGKEPFKLAFTIFLATSLVSVFYAIKTLPETINLKKEHEEGSIKDKKDLKYFLIIIGCISFISNLTAPIYLLYLQDNITKDLALIVFLFIPASILELFLPKRFGSFSDKHGRERIVFIGMLINAILQVFIPLTKAYYSFMLLYTLISLASIFYGPAYNSLIIDFAGEDKRGKSYGLYSFASGIGAALGPIVGSYVYENIGNDFAFFLKAVLLVVMSLIVCYSYIKYTRINKVICNDKMRY